MKNLYQTLQQLDDEGRRKAYLLIGSEIVLDADSGQEEVDIEN